MADFTPSQKKAIKSTDGVFIVRAGAGTGKTRVLINKYIKIYNSLIKKGFDGKKACDSILTVTFTKRAAKEMLERLKNKIDAEHLRYAHISTIDAFCSRLLKENAYIAGLDSKIEIIEGIESKLLFIKIGESILENEISFPIGTEMSKEKFLNESYTLINTLKQRLVSPEEFLEISGSKSSINNVLYKLYKNYESYLTKENLMDFGKLLFTACRLMKSSPKIRKDIQKKFIHVLVDEYQDTNPAQLELLNIISKPQNNFFAVGDEKQSIYGFRGAEPEYIIKHYNNLPPDRKTTLAENFRCRSSIPELINTVFSRVIKDYNKIKCARTQGKADIEVFLAKSRRQEAEYVAARVKQFLNSGYKPSEIALLFRGVKNCGEYEQAMRKLNIGTVTVGGTGFYRQPEIKDIMAMVACAENPHSQRELLRVMRLPIFAFRDSEIASILCKKNKKDTLYGLILKSKDKKAIKLKEFTEKFRNLKNEVSLPELIERMLCESGIIYRAGAQSGGSNSRQLSNIRKFIRQARNFSSKNIFSTLSDFREYLREIEQAGILEAEAKPKAKDVVYLMSIHQAKGLEFPVVLLPNIAPSNFPARMNISDFHFSKDKGLIIKDNSKNSFFTKHIKTKLASDHNKEERRLLYVAMTRPEQKLLISGYQNSRGRISKYMGYFFKKEKDEYLLKDNIKKYVRHIKEFQPPPAEKEEKECEKKEKEAFLRATETLGLPPFYKTKEVPSEFSATQLQTYNECPKKYNYIYNIGIPKPPAEEGFSSLLFGTAVHRMLAEYYKYGGLNTFQKMKEKITSLIISSGMSSKTFSLYYKGKTEKTLRNIFDLNILKKPENVIFVEKPFVIKMKNAYVKGTIDRVDAPKDTAELIDYKTSYSTDTYKFRIQMAVYEIALREIFNINPGSSNIYFLRRGKIKAVPVIKDALLEINNIISSIQAEKFSPRKGKHCKNCSFCSDFY
ncbi:MAG: ATP-dependent helicase [Elusimicrobiota bacterium]